MGLREAWQNLKEQQQEEVMIDGERYVKFPKRYLTTVVSYNHEVDELWPNGEYEPMPPITAIDYEIMQMVSAGKLEGDIEESTIVRLAALGEQSIIHAGGSVEEIKAAYWEANPDRRPKANS